MFEQTFTGLPQLFKGTSTIVNHTGRYSFDALEVRTQCQFYSITHAIINRCHILVFLSQVEEMYNGVDNIASLTDSVAGLLCTV